MTTIAVMQPYFSPYAGMLTGQADIFVLYDCVQFQARWVHRSRFSTETGESTWHVPIKKALRIPPSNSPTFNDNAQDTWTKRLENYTLTVN